MRRSVGTTGRALEDTEAHLAESGSQYSVRLCPQGTESFTLRIESQAAGFEAESSTIGSPAFM